MAAPPLFTNFGKSATDFFKKKFDTDPLTIKATRKAANNITVETGVSSVAENKKKDQPNYLRAYSKFVLGKQSWGSGELEVHQDVYDNNASKVTGKLTSLYPGLLVTLALANGDKKCKFTEKSNANLVPSVEVGYTHSDWLQAQATVKADASGLQANGGQLDLQASLGRGSWSGGGSIAGDTDKWGELRNLNIGGQYSQSDLTASVYTSYNNDNNNKQLNGSFFFNYNSDISTSAIITVESVPAKTTEKAAATTSSSSSAPAAPAAASFLVTSSVGAEVRLDAATSVRSKLVLKENIKSATASLTVEHRLASPAALVSISSDFDVKDYKAPAPKGLALAFSFGDF